MSSNSRHNLTLRAIIVKRMVDSSYEAGRHDRCKRWVYRNIVMKVYPMSERTFFRYLRIAEDAEKPVQQQQEDKRQLKLFE